MSWAERTALVTGASRGIGRAIAERFAQAGLKVAVNFRQDEAGAAAVVEAIRARGGQAEAFGADVAVPAEAETLVDRVRERFGSLDVLVNNAGTTRDTLLLRMRPDDWDAVLATNLSSVFYCTKAALKSMTRQRFGRIVNISSVAGLVGNAGQANYAAAKAGIIGFTKAGHHGQLCSPRPHRDRLSPALDREPESRDGGAYSDGAAGKTGGCRRGGVVPGPGGLRDGPRAGRRRRPGNAVTGG
jgi:NAD(P)-dependent dehydrogenase (short-subunit alcohol dehydrogenase family)